MGCIKCLLSAIWVVLFSIVLLLFGSAVGFYIMPLSGLLLLVGCVKKT